MTARKKTALVRQQIVKASDQLFYQKGYNLTSFSDIAAVSKLPRGNLNYYFQTKDQVLAAVIQYRVDEMKQMLAEWDETFDTPIKRLKRYAQIIFNVKNEVIHYGCPMGTLNSELGKVQKELKTVAKQQFKVFEKWIKKQFQLLGHKKNADELTLHLLVWTQGISTMAYIHQSTGLIEKEVKAIEAWLESLA